VSNRDKQVYRFSPKRHRRHGEVGNFHPIRGEEFIEALQEAQE
jgi:hypothetical protein